MNDQPQHPGGIEHDDEMKEILDSFIIETTEILEHLGQELIELEQRPADAALHNSIFRAVHTIKGTSSFLGFTQLTTLAHRSEDVLNRIRKSELIVTAPVIDLLVDACDTLKLLLQNVDGPARQEVDTGQLIVRLESLSTGIAVPAEIAAAPAVVTATPVASAPQPVPLAAEPAPQEPAKPKAPEPDQAQSAASRKTEPADSTIRVDVNRLDHLLDLVGELVLGRNRLAQLVQQMGDHHLSGNVAKDLSDMSSQIDFITTELQMAVMKTRMIPIAKLFSKLPRLIRDLGKETGKQIDLRLFGEETELDKSIIDELNDPIVHIIRNAADHGIERPEERLRNGKPERGTITVRAEHVGNHIVISIRDDGAGMDPERLKRKALEKGLIGEQQALEMSKREAFNLIFIPGFSTAATVTNVSGRGVGMDVVKTSIAKLKGMVEIESGPGTGSAIIIRLPLTLAIIQGLLVGSGNEIYSIPLGSVLEVVRPRKEDLGTIYGHDIVRVRESVLPLARMSAILGSDGDRTGAAAQYVVIVGMAEQRVGIMVDALIGQKEVVVKSLGPYLGKVRGVAGSTILGDGRVVMIIDIGEFMQLYRSAEQVIRRAGSQLKA